MKKILLSALLLGLFPASAQAALVSSYGLTDDVWATPLAPGKALIDTRAAYVTGNPAQWTLPSLSLVYGVAPGLEVGVWGANGIADRTSTLSVVNPYLKVQLPWKLHSLGFGLVGGVQLPTQANQEHNVALDAVTFFPVNDALSIDLGVGVGQNLLNPTTVGHTNLACYYLLPSGQTLLLEGCSYHDANSTSYGEHVGVIIPLQSGWTSDLSVGFSQGTANTITPQLGVSALF